MQQIHAINFAPFAPRGAFAGPEAAGELCRMQELTGADTVIFLSRRGPGRPLLWRRSTSPDGTPPPTRSCSP